MWGIFAAFMVVMIAQLVQAQKCEVRGDCPSNFYCKNGNCTKMRKPPMKAKKCEVHGDCPSYFYCKDGNCTKMIRPPGACNKNVECIGGSHCENGICTERCRADVDCLMYKGGRTKYCTSGGLVTLVKGYCIEQVEDGEPCTRHVECKKGSFCKNAICKKAEEAVTCSIECVGPYPNRPHKIKVGDPINVTYSCTFARQGPLGPMNITAKLRSNRRIRAGSAKGVSPLTISGSYTENARGGVFTHEIRGEMLRCITNRKNCRWGKRCVLRT